MNYLEFDGPGSTLVFLHGGNVAGWMWGQQVPAFADHHVRVRKEVEGGTTRSSTEALAGEDRVVELSRMLSGTLHAGANSTTFW